MREPWRIVTGDVALILNDAVGVSLATRCRWIFSGADGWLDDDRNGGTDHDDYDLSRNTRRISYQPMFSNAPHLIV